MKTTPPPIRSVEQLFATSSAMEEEAARRYRELAARMRLRDEEPLARLFDFLATIEDKHAGHVTQRARETLGVAASAQSVSWEVPESFDDEAGSSRLLTPYLALAVAVRNEDRAFAFYSYVVADAPNEEARKIAEDLAKDELAHAVLLRRERRKAYHADGSSRLSAAPALPGSVDELWTFSVDSEWRAACYHYALAATQLLQDKAEAVFIDVAEDEESCARETAARVGREIPEPPERLSPTVDGALRLLEEAFDRYADIAGRTADEDIMREAQLLAARAVRRLGLVQFAMK